MLFPREKEAAGDVENSTIYRLPESSDDLDLKQLIGAAGSYCETLCPDTPSLLASVIHTNWNLLKLKGLNSTI